MIAKNYLKHPDALRFQRELFHNGFKNSPRIMRLMECVFKFAPEVPQWAKDAARRARQLVKAWKSAMLTLNFAARVNEGKRTVGFFYGPRGETWSGRGMMPQWLKSLVRAGDPKEAYRWNEQRMFYSLL